MRGDDGGRRRGSRISTEARGIMLSKVLFFRSTGTTEKRMKETMKTTIWVISFNLALAIAVSMLIGCSPKAEEQPAQSEQATPECVRTTTCLEQSEDDPTECKRARIETSGICVFEMEPLTGAICD